jgi:hypothetical protein
VSFEYRYLSEEDGKCKHVEESTKEASSRSCKIMLPDALGSLVAAGPSTKCS